MPHTLTEVATYDATVTVPDGGDTRTAASVDGAFQALANRTKYLNSLVPTSALIWTPFMSCDDGSNVSIGPFTLFDNGTLIQVPTVTVDNSVPVVADTWYYGYVHNNAGSPVITWETTAPDAALVYKTGDTSRYYLGVVRTRSAGAVLSFEMRARRYIYRFSQYAFSENKVLAAGAATVFTDVANLPNRIPSTAKLAVIKSEISGTTAGQEISFLITKGDSGGAAHLNYFQGATGGVSGMTEEIRVNSSQLIQYKVSASPAVVDLFSMGFTE